MSGQVSGAETANFSGTSKTHNSWQPSDSFLFSYPLLSPGLGWSAAGVVTLTGSGELIPAQPTGLPVGKHRARTWAEERRGIPWSLVCSLRPGFSVRVNTALAEEVVNHTALSFSPIFCNNWSILWRIMRIMAVQWIWEGVTMSTINNYNDTTGCEIIKRRWAMFCKS